MTSPRPWRFVPGQLLVALATMRRHLGRAFTVGTNAAGGHGTRVSTLKGTIRPDVTTPPVSPLPDDDDIMSFYLLRHGQTNFNAVGRIQGTLDSSVLTDQGISQAHDVGKTLARSPELEFGPTVIVSPMRRAQETLACVRQEFQEVRHDFQTVEVVPDIREIELFEWQGQLVEDIKTQWPEEYEAWTKDPSNFNFSGRYPAKELWTRASKAWEEIFALESIGDQRKILVVAHNAINQALLWTALGCDSSYFRKLPWPNCAVLELQWRRGQKQADRYRWVVPEPSPYVEASDAVRLMKRNEDDNKYTL